MEGGKSHLNIIVDHNHSTDDDTSPSASASVPPSPKHMVASQAQQEAMLCNYSRHVPRLLIKQLLSSIAESFFDKKSNGNLKPSIERFYGPLLFIDISGFTALSTKLPIEELRIHINTYFDKIINIVERFGGQVVKFAGDALFIIWQSPITVVPGNESLSIVLIIWRKINHYQHSKLYRKCCK